MRPASKLRSVAPEAGVSDLDRANSSKLGGTTDGSSSVPPLITTAPGATSRRLQIPDPHVGQNSRVTLRPLSPALVKERSSPVTLNPASGTQTPR